MRVTLILICCFFSLFIPAFLVGPVFASTAELAHYDAPQFPPPLENYHDSEMGLAATLVNRVKNNPFNLLATLIFS